jgi:hypothetical protein
MRILQWRFGWIGLLLTLVVGAWAQQVATGVVFHDRNRNGIRDAGEPGIPNVLVSNQREVVKTDAQGRYRTTMRSSTGGRIFWCWTMWCGSARRQVFDALAPFANTLSFSAHTHVQMHRFFGADTGWKGRTPHHHINAVTVCGSW